MRPAKPPIVHQQGENPAGLRVDSRPSLGTSNPWPEDQLLAGWDLAWEQPKLFHGRDSLNADARFHGC